MIGIINSHYSAKKLLFFKPLNKIEEMTSLNGLYKNIYWWYFVTSLVSLPVIFFPDQGMTIFICVISVIISSGFMLYKSIALFKKTPGPVYLPAFFLGVFIVAGGSILDMSVTVIFSPDLIEEGNPLIISLLNNHTPIWFVYFFILLYQVLKVSTHLFLWTCFLKIYPKIIKTIPYLNFLTTIKWLMGFGKVSFLDFLLGRNMQYHYFMSSFIFVIVMSCFIHFYVSMEWLKIIPILFSSHILISFFFFIATLILVLMTHFKIKRNHQYSISNNFNG